MLSDKLRQVDSDRGHGYYIGGANNSFENYSNAIAISFSSHTLRTLSALCDPTAWSLGVSSPKYGIRYGGVTVDYSNPYLFTYWSEYPAQKFQFKTESMSQYSLTIDSSGIADAEAVIAFLSKGYIFRSGHMSADSPPLTYLTYHPDNTYGITRLVKIDFENEAQTQLLKNIDYITGGASCQNQVSGYAFSGIKQNSDFHAELPYYFNFSWIHYILSLTSSSRKLVKSSETLSIPLITLNPCTSFSKGASSNTSGYILSGIYLESTVPSYFWAPNIQIQGINFSDSTLKSVLSTLPNPNVGTCVTYDNTDAILAGGDSLYPNPNLAIDDFNMVTESVYTTSTTLSTQRNYSTPLNGK